MIQRTDIAYVGLKRFRESNADSSYALISMMCIDVGCHTIVTFGKKTASIGMEKLQENQVKEYCDATT